MRVAVIGLGLIGGSVALAARQRLGAETVGWDPDAAAVDAAVARGALVSGAGSLASAVTEADAVFVAAPVCALPDLVGAALAAAPAGCLVTDVGSTKRAVVAAHHDRRFTGGHPLAGAQHAGVAHASADLFDGEFWYLTPGPASAPELLQRLRELVIAFGSRPVEIDAVSHDELLARFSHLPHVLANVLVAQAAAGAEGRAAAGPSFRDATRVAGANTAMWTDIYRANRSALVPVIDDTIARLTAVRELLERGDAKEIAAWNDAAAADRNHLMETS